MKEFSITVDEKTEELIRNLFKGGIVEFNGVGNGGVIRSVARQLAELRKNNYLMIARDNKYETTIMKLLCEPRDVKKKKRVWGGFEIELKL